MLNALAIENFRGIKHGKLEGLTKVNVFIGKNNSGKSTILEALYFVKAALEPADILNNPVLKHLLDRRIARRMISSEEFLYRYNPSNKITFKLLFEENKTILIESGLIGNNLKYELILPGVKRSPTIVVPPTSRQASISNFQLQHQRPSESAKHPFEHIMKKLEELEETSEIKSYFVNNRKEFSFLSHTSLIDTDIVRKIEDMETKFWKRVRRKGMDKKIVTILNEIYQTRIEDLALIPFVRPGDSDVDEGGERRTFHKLTAAVQDSVLNIDGYGEGLRDSLSIILLASQLDNTALLIEEPEAHQHPQALNRIFGYLFEIARKNNLQLFITTHSLDVLSALTNLSNDYEITVFHTNLDPYGKLTTRTMRGPDAKLLMDLGADLRFLSRLFSYLIIEGMEDRVFLNAISKKIYNKSLEEFPYEILETSKNAQKEVLKTVVSTGKHIKVFRDYDEKREIAEIVDIYANSLKTKYKEVKIENNRIIVGDTGSHVTIMATGLPGDSDLDSVGVNRYAMEDYLLKLLAIDKKIKKWSQVSIKRLRRRADKLRTVGPLNKSKTLLAALGFIKELSKEDLIKEMIENSDQDTLHNLIKPITDEVFQ